MFKNFNYKKKILKYVKNKKKLKIDDAKYFTSTLCKKASAFLEYSKLLFFI